MPVSSLAHMPFKKVPISGVYTQATLIFPYLPSQNTPNSFRMSTGMFKMTYLFYYNTTVLRNDKTQQIFCHVYTQTIC